MRILQINVWNGRIKGALLDYFRHNKFDLVCMQEAVWGDNRDGIAEDFFVSVEQIRGASGLEYEFRSANWELDAFRGNVMKQGIVILSREKIVSKEEKDVYPGAYTIEVPNDLRDHLYKAQLVKLESGINVVNYHGYWLKDPLGDENTITAMKNVVEMIKATSGPLIMCGDLNIIHESPAMRDLDFLRDLTNEYNIQNTLSGLKFGGKVACDHILVNEQINVKDFRVIDDIISDHKALFAEIEKAA